jgi:hypothetical protein
MKTDCGKGPLKFGEFITRAREVWGNPLNQINTMPLWLRAQAQMNGFRSRELEQTHWKKIARSILED